MKFETLLAKRYIQTQKRHSALTICSIAIALALITLLCSSFTTLRGIQRAASYDAQPYHVMFYSVTKNQAAAISHMNQVGSCELKANPDGQTYQAQVIFSDYIDDHWTYLSNMISGLKLNASYDELTGAYSGLDLNYSLMKLDLINLDGRYEAVQILALFFVFIIFFVLALRLVIDTAFEVSSKECERQFGVLQSVGATPKQIVRILTAEGLMLSALGIPLGIALGILFGYLAFRAVLSSGIAEIIFTTEKAAELVRFHISPWLIATSAVIGLCWVLFSAYGTGMRIIRKSPVQAITARSNTIKKVKKHTLLSLLFGWKGKLASRNARRQPKRFVITVLSLTVSLTLFASVSAVMDSVQKFLIDAMMIYDEFGLPEFYDFDLILSTGEKTVLKDPLGYQESVQLLQDSGYFEEPYYYISDIGKISPSDKAQEKGTMAVIYYVSRATYQHIFGDDPEISYDDLTKSGGAVLLNTAETVIPANTNEISIDCKYLSEITEDAYIRLQAEKEKNPDEATITTMQFEIYDENTNTSSYYWCSTEKKPVSFKIVRSIYRENAEEFWDTQNATLILTEETYQNGDWEKYGKIRLGGVIANVNLLDDRDYSAAKSFLFANGDMFHFHEDDPDIEVMDRYGLKRRVLTMISAIKIGLMFILGMIALIAVVNMVNIVSTGILNRKHELAAIQCVGMTRGQMYGMTVIECLQFTLWAAIAASILCTLLLFATEMFFQGVGFTVTDEKQSLISYAAPVSKVWLASIAALVCALTASVLPLHRMQKDPLVEQIRAAE